MFEIISPERAGISSAHLADFFACLARTELAMHSVLIMKGDALLCEQYWAPFDRAFCHRMYSQTKSFVSIAVGLLIEDGKLHPDDRIADHFPDKIDGALPPEIARQTVREMLMMRTSLSAPSWFTCGDPDRVHHYFNHGVNVRPALTLWEYDSAGSQVLCALCERLTGMPLLDFLRERIFRHMGTFTSATMLKTPNGDSWGDSALLCTTRDVASFGRLLMRGGEYDGKQLVNAAYIKEATSPLSDNDTDGWRNFREHGYGYQFWCCEAGAFAMVGMGGQLTVCFPEQDLLFACTADLQGNPLGYDAVMRPFYELVLYRMQPTSLPENATAAASLADVTADLRLLCARGQAHVPFADELNGKTYLCPPNATGITRFCFTFSEDGGIFRYVNAQGEKELAFGLCRNAFCRFPQDGYSDSVGGERTANGHRYQCAASAAWTEPLRLVLRVQIIDRYFGNLRAAFAFRDDRVCVTMHRCAEDFLGEYEGTFVARLAP